MNSPYTLEPGNFVIIIEILVILQGFHLIFHLFPKNLNILSIIINVYLLDYIFMKILYLFFINS
jgi:hypothetical protein